MNINRCFNSKRSSKMQNVGNGIFGDPASLSAEPAGHHQTFFLTEDRGNELIENMFRFLVNTRALIR